MSLKGLQRVLRKRLPTIKRWKKVTVYNWDSPRMPEDLSPGRNTFVIYWNGIKGKNVHPFEAKEIPLSDLDDVIEKNRMRLRNDTITYK